MTQSTKTRTTPTAHTVTVYTTSWCPDCHAAKRFLDEHGVAYREIDIEAEPQAAELVMSHNEGKRRVPTFDIAGSLHGNPPLSELATLLGLSEGTPEAVEHRRLIILGNGPAGLTAALYAARADLQPLVLRGAQPGGQLTTTTEVENFPGFPEGIGGPQLMERLERQATRFGAELRWGTVTRVDLSRRPFRLQVDGERWLAADALILSTGASPKYLGVAGEARLLGRGVSVCATCDGAFFRGREVAVVGGGDSALEEALFLTRYATRVHLVHRREELRASVPLQERARRNEAITFHLQREVEEVLGAQSLEAVRLRHVETGEVEELPVAALFVAIGHRPNTELFRPWLATDDAGYLVLEGRTSRTRVPGVFASGDVQDAVYRQAITAAGSGAAAALDAERWLAEEAAREEGAELPGAGRSARFATEETRGTGAAALSAGPLVASAGAQGASTAPSTGSGAPTLTAAR